MKESLDIVFWPDGYWIEKEELDEQVTDYLGGNYLPLTVKLPQDDNAISDMVKEVIKYKTAWHTSLNEGNDWKQEGRLTELENQISLPSAIKEAIIAGWG